MNREEAEQRARQQEHWRAAVKKTMETWMIPQEEAEEIVTELYWEVTADAIAFGILSPITIDHIRDALATYDRTHRVGRVEPDKRT